MSSVPSLGYFRGGEAVGLAVAIKVAEVDVTQRGTLGELLELSDAAGRKHPLMGSVPGTDNGYRGEDVGLLVAIEVPEPERLKAGALAQLLEVADAAS